MRSEGSALIVAELLTLVIQIRSSELSQLRKYSKEITRLKIMQWCDKAERCHFEVQTKLLSWNTPFAECQLLIAELISLNLLSEQRYALAFAHDKFTFFHWGIRKIEMELKKRFVSEPIIRLAIRSLDSDDYSSKIRALIEKKEPQLMGLQLYQKKIKLARYLISKGFESDKVWRELDHLEL